MRARWYFDLISPFSYLHLKQFSRLPAALDIEYVPVLFAGLLKHWEHKGPAEIPAKRIYIYRQVTWLAGRLGIPFRLPPGHPFNPLPALRLLIAAGTSRANVETAFDLIWRDGQDVQDPAALRDLAARLHVAEPQAALADESIKARLRSNTEAAVAAGVFGVPSFQLGELLFWGQDSLDMMLDYLGNPALFDSAEMRRINALPVGTVRKETR